jgi:asparagine synthase (glutamine-hydrolysing)
MSFQFGTWNFDGQPVDPSLLDRVLRVTERYGFDGREIYSIPSIVILYRPFHNTSGSQEEQQPFLSSRGNVMTWDGRLDNRSELETHLSLKLAGISPDIPIVIAAYESLGTEVFSKLIGDWALTVWRGDEKALILAKDPLGTRSLYYSLESTRITWSTMLEPLVLLKQGPMVLNEEYIAGYLANYPATHLTPYSGIDSVPPGSFIRIHNGHASTRTFWSFDPNRRIRYRTDREYEQHFRAVFAESVKRRLRSDSPILAELSGGMDSSSIVCMADLLIARGEVRGPSVDTISYFDDSEPNWNERRYFTKVEEKRGQTGFHINVQGLCPFAFEEDVPDFCALPSSHAIHSEIGNQCTKIISARRTRSLLSGVGGDEILGGVPTPIPEFADLFSELLFLQLARKLKAWSLAKREPWMHVLARTLRLFLPMFTASAPDGAPVPWLRSDYRKRNRKALSKMDARLRLFAAPPSYQDNLSTFALLQKQIACQPKCPAPYYDTLYPMLDLDLLQFVFAIPREQLVRPNQRRSLMRRSLTGLLPDEIIERKRKAYPTRGPRLALLAEESRLANSPRVMTAASFGIFDSTLFAEALRAAAQGKAVPIPVLARTVHLEYWLRHLQTLGFIDRPKRARTDHCRNSIHIGLNVVQSEKEKDHVL